MKKYYVIIFAKASWTDMKRIFDDMDKSKIDMADSLQKRIHRLDLEIQIRSRGFHPLIAY